MLGAAVWTVATAQTVVQPQPAKPAGDTTSEIHRMDPFTVVPNEEGYIQSTSTVATRSNRPTIEIPQTISVFTDEFLTDIGAHDANAAIAYVGNTYVRDDVTVPGNTIMRGFERSGEVYVDGFRNASFPRDAAAYDRLEVVKGPPSAVQGRSGSSGLINWVTKKPTFGRNFAKATLTYVEGGFQECLCEMGSARGPEGRVRTARGHESLLGFRGDLQRFPLPAQ